MGSTNFYGFRLLVRHHGKPLVCWMAARGNLEVLSNSAELDEAEEARLMGLPARSWYQSPSYPTPEAISAGFLLKY